MIVTMRTVFVPEMLELALQMRVSTKQEAYDSSNSFVSFRKAFLHFLQMKVISKV
jgi:hypothetical protein